MIYDRQISLDLIGPYNDYYNIIMNDNSDIDTGDLLISECEYNIGNINTFYPLTLNIFATLAVPNKPGSVLVSKEDIQFYSDSVQIPKNKDIRHAISEIEFAKPCLKIKKNKVIPQKNSAKINLKFKDLEENRHDETGSQIKEEIVEESKEDQVVINYDMSIVVKAIYTVPNGEILFHIVRTDHADDYIKGIKEKSTLPLVQKYKKDKIENDKKLAHKDEELACKKKELEDKKKEIARKDDELAHNRNELARKDEELVRKDEELVRERNELARERNELARNRNVLADKDDELAQKDDELAYKDDELDQKDDELDHIKLNIRKK